MHTLLVLALLIGTSIADSSVGCFASLPSSWESKGTYQYQSRGYCGDECTSSKYFAMSNGNECYCGDELPTDSSDSCSTTCTGYTQDMCGGDDSYSVYSQAENSYYGDTSSSSSSVGSSTKVSSPSKFSTATTSSTTSTTSSSTSSSSSTTSSSSGTTSSPSQTVISSVVTTGTNSASPSVIYITKTGSATSATQSATSSAKPEKSGGLNKGAVIGGVVGGVVGAIFIFAVVFFCLWRQRNMRNDDDDDTPLQVDDAIYDEALKRNPSSPENPFESPKDVVDPRLNPVLLGRRRLSEGSLADEADYSRKILRVANPDD